MSNIANTLDYLRTNPTGRFLLITNQDTGKQVGKQRIFLADIPNENLEQYIKTNLGTIDKLTLIWIEMRSVNGTSTKKENTCKVEVMPDNFIEVPIPKQSLPPVQNLPIPAVPQNSFLGQPDGQNHFGLGLPQILEYHAKSSRLQDKEEQLKELKEDHTALKRKYENDIDDQKRKFNILEDETRKLRSDLHLAESQKEMAVLVAKSENSSFFDTPAFEKLMDKAPDLMNGFVAMKTGIPVVSDSGALGQTDYSEAKNDLLDCIENNIEDDFQINTIGAIIHYMNNQDFMGKLNALITQTKNANGIGV